jgi:hypothetical protein
MGIMSYLYCLFYCTLRYPTRLDRTSNMVGILIEAGTAYPSRAPVFTPVCDGTHVTHLFRFLIYMSLFCVFFPMLHVSLGGP